MKNLFSINKSSTDNAVAFDDNPYLVRRVSEETRERLDHAFDILRDGPEAPPLTPEQQALKKRASLFSWIGIGCLAVAIVLFLTVGTGGHIAVTVAQFALLLASIVTTFIGRRTNLKLNTDRQDSMKTDFSAATENLNAAAERAARELGVPHGAAGLEILPYHYKMSGGTAVRVGKKNRFDNISTSAWIEKDALCLATAQELFRVPLASIRATRFIDEEYEIDFWLKAEVHNSEAYKPFNIRSAGVLGKKSRGFYAVEIGDGDDGYEFFIPGYDWAVYEGLMGEKS